MAVYRMNNRLFFLYATSNTPHYGMSEIPSFYGDKTASTHAWHKSNINNNAEWYERKGIISNYCEKLQYICRYLNNNREMLMMTQKYMNAWI